MHSITLPFFAAFLTTSLRAASPYAALPAGAPASYAATVINAHEAAHSRANGINNRGDVCGEWHNADYSVNEGVLRSSSHLQQSIAPAPGYGGISILGINDAGDTVGFMERDSFVRKAGVYTILSAPGAALTYARAISDGGTVAGDAFGPGGGVAWTWNTTTGYVTLSGLPGYTGHGAVGINSAGEVVGYSTRPVPGDPDSTETAQWLFSGGNFTPVTWPGTNRFSLSGINDHGDLLVCFRHVSTGAHNRYAVRSEGTFREIKLTFPAGLADPIVAGFSSCGEVVGYCTDGGGKYHAFRGRPSWLPELTETHADLSLTFSAGQFRMQVSDSDVGVAYEPDRVLIAARMEARRLIPSIAGFSFLGTPGASTWILPQGQEPGVPWLGMTSLITAGVLQGPVAVSLDSVTGAGSFSLYSVSGLGGPTLLINSADGIHPATDRVTLNPGSHVHYNFAFSAPGLWKLRFRIRGTPSAGGAEIVSPPQELTFWLEPGNIFPVRMGTPVLSAATLKIPLTAEVGRECVLHTSTDLVNWSAGQRFITTTRDFTLTQPATSSRVFFRADIR